MAIEQKKLTKKGRRRLRFFIVLIALACVVVGVFIGIAINYPDDFEPTIPLIAIVLPGLYYGYLKNKLLKTIRKQVLTAMGFEKVGSSKILKDYNIFGLGKLAIDEVYSGAVDSQPFKLVHFNVTVGSGKSRVTYNRIGVEFLTTRNHLPVQIYDYWAQLKPMFKRSVKLESNDFHKYFTVYSQNTKDAYYQLDPDTMHDLMVLRKELGFALNLESVKDRIFINVDESVFYEMIKKILSFTDVLNEEFSWVEVEMYRKNIDLFLRRLLKIFATLDYKLKV